jgi:hypothetical protein
MRRAVLAVLWFAVAVAATLTPKLSFAADGESPATIGLGFRTTQAPIGGRWWITSMIGVDAGFGFSSEEANTFDLGGNEIQGTLESWAVDAGLPLCLKQWQRVHFIARPGFFYRSEDDAETFFLLGEFEKRTEWVASLDLEVEIFLAANASVSASHGIAYVSEQLESEDTANTRITSRGGNLTAVGFHVYLW